MYLTYDDIYPGLPERVKEALKKTPNIFETLYGKNATVADMKRKLEPWEVNPRCLRSIKFKYNKKKVQKKTGATQAEVDALMKRINDDLAAEAAKKNPKQNKD